MIFITKLIVVLAVGTLVGFVVLQLIKNISQTFRKVFSARASDMTKLPKTDYFKFVVESLSANPNSAVSNYIKLAISFFVFVIVQFIAGKFLFSVLFAGMSYILIGKQVKKQTEKKMKLFENQLIEALGMITNSVRAGQSLLQALENMVKDTKPPISIEFEDALKQIKLGIPINQALLDITKRVKSKDLKIAIISINLARETGGNLGEILTRLASTMRERRKIQGKISSLTAQGRTSGMIMSCVPFLLLGVLYFLEPTMMGLLFTTVIGNILIVIAVCMIFAGMFFINKIVNIDI